VDFRVAEESLQTRITIVLVDKKNCIIIELKDDTKEISFFAAGLATYSDSKSIISSYASIFESLWKQNELYEQLKTHAKMQEEFINVAAHELRTPIQPILGLTELLRIQIKDVNQRKLLDIAIRNARRLQRLTEDILDVTKIETKSLVLKKELFDLNEVIIDEISDANNQISKGNKVNRLDIKLEPKGHRHEPTLIKADRERIGQVVSNLLSNAIKFTHEGSISVIIDKSKSANEVVVSIKDTGSGLDPDILSRLFSKFATKSDKGTGLGLFISKSIIEANGGRIFAENNVSGKGATFTFILPISD
jgi:signal transduction histidine kinase